jgi:tight adherence protein C
MWEVQRFGTKEPAGERPDAAGNALTRAIEALGTAMIESGMLSASTLNEVQETLTNTRLRGARGLSLFIGLKMMLLFGLPLLTIIGGSQSGISAGPLLSLSAVASIVGLLAPDYIIKAIRSRYLKQVEAGLADALDMMVICAEAGLGLEPSLARVAREIGHAHPAIAAELTQTVSELRLSADTAAALGGIGTRTGLEGLKRVASVLAQTLRYGTPLGQALRVLSAEMRQETMVRFEARAARLPVLLTLPMIAFILPCLFLIVGGPAIVQTLHAMHH